MRKLIYFIHDQPIATIIIVVIAGTIIWTVFTTGSVYTLVK